MRTLAVPDFVFPVLAACVFVLLMSRLEQKTRLRLNAMLMIGASGVYLSGGFGLYELLYAFFVCIVVGYQALDNFAWIGVGWFTHTAWDVLHHLYGAPIWPFMPSSSFGCALFDAVIGLWFLAGAPATRSEVQWFGFFDGSALRAPSPERQAE